MTGLAGYIGRGDGSTRDHCARMLRSQTIYGPDHEAIWTEGTVSFGRRLFRRLSEDNHDRGPVRTADGRFALVADLRLDNRQELSRQVDLSSPEAARLSDAALLMRLLTEGGEAWIERIIGDFAFAFWDAHEQRLLLARDFLGQRPLHYHAGRDFFAFASMPKGLHALPEVPYGIDEESAARLLGHLPEAGARTFFKDISRVEPGHVVTVTRSRISSRKYWAPRLSPLRLKRHEEYVEAVREALDIAVAARLRGAGDRVAAQLSAGLDSSGVAATAARLLLPSSGRVTAFTAVPRPGYDVSGFRHVIADEGPLAAAVAAAHPNIDHVPISPGPNSPLAELDRNFFLFERPVLNICNGVWSAAINEAARTAGLTVMLNGRIGNASFSHSGLGHLAELASTGRLLSLAGVSRRLAADGVPWSTIAGQTMSSFMPDWLWRSLQRLREPKGLPSPSALNPKLRESFAAERPPRGDRLETRLWLLGRVDFGNYNKGTLAGWGIDSRDPTADRRLVELCLSIPEEHYLARARPRGLAREVLADRLPYAVVSERRKGYQAADWHEGVDAAREAIEQEVSSLAQSPAANIIDTGRLVQLVRSWPTGSWNDRRVAQEYRFALLRGLSVGSFIRRAGRTNR